MWSWILPLYVCQDEGLGYPQPPLFPFGMLDPEVVRVIYHLTPFCTEFLGPKSHRHPGPPPPPTVVWWDYLLPQAGLELKFFGRMGTEYVSTRPLLLGSCSAGSGE